MCPSGAPHREHRNETSKRNRGRLRLSWAGIIAIERRAVGSRSPATATPRRPGQRARRPDATPRRQWRQTLIRCTVVTNVGNNQPCGADGRSASPERSLGRPKGSLAAADASAEAIAAHLLRAEPAGTVSPGTSSTTTRTTRTCWPAWATRSSRSSRYARVPTRPHGRRSAAGHAAGRGQPGTHHRSNRVAAVLPSAREALAVIAGGELRARDGSAYRCLVHEPLVTSPDPYSGPSRGSAMNREEPALAAGSWLSPVVGARDLSATR